MPSFSELSIKGRLVLAFLVLVTVMSISSYLSISFFQNASQEMRVMVEDQTRRAILAQRAAKRIQVATVQLLTLLQTEQRADRVPLYRIMDEALRGVDAAFRTLSKELSSPELSRYLELRDLYAERFQATVEEIEFNGLDAARLHFADNTQPILTEMLEEAEKVSLAQQDSMMASEEKYREKSAELSRIILLIQFLAVLLTLAFSYLLARSIAALLETPVAVADRIASGDYITEIPQARTPELRKLLKALDLMRVGILGREGEIRRLAFQDRLTGLGSRTYFMQQLESEIKTQGSAVVLFDINRFNQINKALGHRLGDETIVAVAEKLKQITGEDSRLSRLEANRFGAILPTSRGDQLRAFVSSVFSAFEEALSVHTQKIHIDLRASITTRDLVSAEPESLLRAAEAGLETAKHSRSSYIEVAAAEEQLDELHLTLLGELKTALVEEQFRLVYQPKWCTEKQRIVGVEALIRWEHPQRGFIRPDLFIPFCEMTGFIRQITPWVMNEAFAAASRWNRSGVDVVVSINLSTLDLDNPQLESQLRQTLSHHQLDPGKICFEITESALMLDPEAARDQLQRLRKLGFKLSIDDYGTGQASLAYVRDLPVQELKIDRSFITNVDKEPRTAAIVRSTLKLCQDLGIAQVAEGVENLDELNWLRAERCSLIQGYLISKPLPEQELLCLINQDALPFEVVRETAST